jgi:chromosome segregation ATPase
MPDTPKPRLDGTITLGNLLQIGVLAVGFGAFLLTSAGRIDQTAREVSDLKQSMAHQATSTRESIRESMARVEATLTGINTQIQLLPPMSERLRRLEADVSRLQEADADLSTRIENRRNIVDQRMDNMHRQVIESATRLEALSRASATNLPGSPGVRR